METDISRDRDFCLPHLHSTPPLGGSRWNIAMTFGTENLKWCGYPMVKIVEDMFILFDRMYERVRRTDGRTQHDGISRSRIASRGKNWRSNKLSNFQYFLTKFWMAIAKLFSCKFYLNLLRCCYFMRTPCRVTVFAARCCKRDLCRHAVSVSVCLSVTFVNAVESKRINISVKKFSPSSSHTILVGGIECRRGRQKSRFWAGFTACCGCQSDDRPGVIQTAPPDRGPACCDNYRWY